MQLEAQKHFLRMRDRETGKILPTSLERKTEALELQRQLDAVRAKNAEHRAKQEAEQRQAAEEKLIKSERWRKRS